MRSKTAMGSITRPAGLILMGAQLTLAFSFFILTASNVVAAPLQGLPSAVKPALPTLAPGPVGRKALTGCPRLVARELHIVRVVPQRMPGGGQTFRYILNGTIENRGLAGIATAGLNVTQRAERGVKRIALKLFKQSVQPNQRLDLSADLHLQVQSDPIRPTANAFPSFTLNVTNLRNDYGQCADAQGTEVGITSEAVRQALPVQHRKSSSLQVGPVNKLSRQTKDKMEHLNSGSDKGVEGLQSKMKERAEATRRANDTINEIDESKDEVIRNVQ